MYVHAKESVDVNVYLANIELFATAFLFLASKARKQKVSISRFFTSGNLHPVQLRRAILSQARVIKGASCFPGNAIKE